VKDEEELFRLLAANQASIAPALKAAQSGAAQSVHQLRRAIKAQRALLRLLPRQCAKPLDMSLQTIAKLFAPQRDAHVAAQLSARLAETEKSVRMKTLWQALASALKAESLALKSPSSKAIAEAAIEAENLWRLLGSAHKKMLLSANVDKSIDQAFRQLRAQWLAKRGARSSRAWHQLRRRLIRLHLQWRNFADVEKNEAQDILCEQLRRDLGVVHDLEMLSDLMAAHVADKDLRDRAKRRLTKLQRLARKDANRQFKKLFKFKKLATLK
jgi:hypothetical protein